MKTILFIKGAAGGPLRKAGVTTFDALWTWPGEPVDAPNRRGSGFSAVSRHALPRVNAGVQFYRKCQQNYFPRRSLGRRDLLLRREYRALCRFRRHGIDCPEVAAIALRDGGSGRQGVLVTVALVDHASLDELLRNTGGRLPDDVSKAVAGFLRRMHGHRLFHGNLYPKHLFVHRALGAGRAVADPVRIIDLEDARWLPWTRPGAVRDLEKLDRYSEGVSVFRRLRFFLRYVGATRLNRRQRRLLDAVVARGRRRSRESA